MPLTLDDDIKKLVENAIIAGAPQDEALKRGMAKQTQRTTEAIARSQKNQQTLTAPPAEAQPVDKGFLGNAWESFKQPFVKTGKTIGGLAFETGRVIGNKLGNDVYVDKQGNTIQNPFLSSEELEKYNKDPLGALLDQGKASANIASYAIPFGKGANFLTKAIIPGAAVGGVQSATEDNASVGSVLKGTLGGGLTAGGLYGAGKLTKGLLNIGSKGSGAASDMAVKSQYNAGKVMNKELNFGQTISELKDYGIKNINDVVDIAPKVTGEDGIISRMTDRAISKSKPIEVGGLAQFAKDLVSSTKGISIGKAQADGFIALVKRGINAVGGKDIVKGDPLKVHQFIRELESSAAGLAKGNATSADKSLASIYRSMAQELKTRLYETAGADKALADGVIKNSEYQILKEISPKLADKVMSAKTVGQLRAIASPFVKGSQLAGETMSANSNKMISGKDILGAGPGATLGFLFGGGGGAALGAGLGYVARRVAETPKGATAISNILGKVGSGLNNAGNIGISSDIVGKLGRTTGLSLQSILQQPATRTGASAMNPPQSVNTPESTTSTVPADQGTPSTPTESGRSVTMDALTRAAADPEISSSDWTQLKQIYDMETKDMEGGTKGTRSEFDKKFEFAGRQAQQALDVLQKNNVKTGPIEAILAPGKEMTGLQNESTLDLKSKIAVARTAARNALLGANMSAKELESLLDYVFDFNQPRRTLEQRLKSFVNSMEDYTKNVAGGGTTVEDILQSQNTNTTGQ